MNFEFKVTVRAIHFVHCHCEKKHPVVTINTKTESKLLNRFSYYLIRSILLDYWSVHCNESRPTNEIIIHVVDYFSVHFYMLFRCKKKPKDTFCVIVTIWQHITITRQRIDVMAYFLVMYRSRKRHVFDILRSPMT